LLISVSELLITEVKYWLFFSLGPDMDLVSRVPFACTDRMSG
jgi:hypothetical protein